MSQLIRVASFGGILCTIASAALAAAPGFRPDKSGLARRFCFFCRRGAQVFHRLVTPCVMHFFQCVTSVREKGRK
jgi:hypothetical protein